LTPDANEADRAWQRELEQPKRNLPTGGGGEFPGQSKAAPVSPAAPVASAASEDSASLASLTGEAQVVTASNLPFAAQPGSNLIPAEGTSAKLPEARYPDVRWYDGPLPNLKAVSAPTPGFTPVPGTAWAVEHSWGEVRPLENYPHRDWAAMQTTYEAAAVKHNPTYFAPLWPQVPVPQNDATWTGNALSSIIEVPWMGLQTLALPVTMFIDPPLAQVTTQRLGRDPVYLGHTPAGGPIVPAPFPGVLRWSYPFLREAAAGTMPATTQPITPTPGIVLPVEGAVVVPGAEERVFPLRSGEPVVPGATTVPAEPVVVPGP
jgi:hypothetical protein